MSHEVPLWLQFGRTEERERQVSDAKEGRVLGVDSHIFEGVKRLTWTSLIRALRNVPKVGCLGDRKGAREKRHWLSVLLGSVVNSICTVVTINTDH